MVLVVVVSIFFMNKVSPSMPSFWIPHIIKTKRMFIHYFNFAVLVYTPTTNSLCNHTPQFKNNVRPVGLLVHMWQ